MLKHAFVFIGISSFVIALSSACGGGGKSCTQLCTEAKQGNCTRVKDCQNFCLYTDKLKGPANCGSQYNDYQSCLSAKPAVCDSTCTPQENAFASCMTTYCSKNLTSDCIALASTI